MAFPGKRLRLEMKKSKVDSVERLTEESAPPSSSKQRLGERFQRPSVSHNTFISPTKLFSEKVHRNRPRLTFPYAKPVDIKPDVPSVENVKRQMDEYKRRKSEKIMQTVRCKLSRLPNSRQNDQGIPETVLNTDYGCLLRKAAVLGPKQNCFQGRSRRGSPVLPGSYHRSSAKLNEYVAGQAETISVKRESATTMTDQKPINEISNVLQSSLNVSCETDVSNNTKLLISDKPKEVAPLEPEKSVRCQDPSTSLRSSTKLQEPLVSEMITTQDTENQESDETAKQTVLPNVSKINRSNEFVGFCEEQTLNAVQEENLSSTPEDGVESGDAEGSGSNRSCDIESDVIFVCETPKVSEDSLAVVCLFPPSETSSTHGPSNDDRKTSKTNIEDIENFAKEHDLNSLNDQHNTNSVLNVVKKEIIPEFPTPVTACLALEDNVTDVNMLARECATEESPTRDVSHPTSAPLSTIHSAISFRKSSEYVDPGIIKEKQKTVDSSFKVINESQETPESPGCQDVPFSILVKSDLDQTAVEQGSMERYNWTESCKVNPSAASSVTYKDVPDTSNCVKAEDMQGEHEGNRDEMCSAHQNERGNNPLHLKGEKGEDSAHSTTLRKDISSQVGKETRQRSNIIRRVSEFKDDMFVFFANVFNPDVPRNGIVMTESVSKLIAQFQEIEEYLNSEISAD